MRSYSYFLLLCCFLLAACNTRQPEFLREETLTLALMPLQGVTNSWGLEVKSPFLIVQNNPLQREDSLFHIYNLNDYKLASVFGMKGRGPNEFLYPIMFRTQLPDVVITDFWNDFITYRIGIRDDGIPVFKGTKQPNYIYGVANAAIINDSLFVEDDFIDSPHLHVLSFDDELPRKSWQYGDPAIRNRFIDPNRGRVYANDARVVFCYYFKKQIDFMDIDLNFVKRVQFDYAPPSSITEQNQLEVKDSYTFGYLGKRYFYALFQGVPYNEYKDLSFCGSILEVFDLDGNPVIKYRFDGIAPDSFVIDEETFTLYGRRSDGEPEDHLLVYKLKGLS